MKKTIDDFYVQFENRFRGDEELVRKKLYYYRNLLKCYIDVVGSLPTALDIGCGRGEFLSLLTEVGFYAEGLEINNIFVKLSKSKGFNVAKQDALTYLQGCEDCKYNVISAIHVIEHLKFDYLFEMTWEVHRVLKKNGLFLLEFPNITNLKISTVDFWIDPTHLKPVNPHLITFLLEYIGFKKVYVIRKEERREEKRLGLIDIYDGESPDIVILAFKEEISQKIIEEMERMYRNQNVSFLEKLRIIDNKFIDMERRIDLTAEKVEKMWNSKLWKGYNLLKDIIRKVILK